jgi:hypothetical protein
MARVIVEDVKVSCNMRLGEQMQLTPFQFFTRKLRR